MTTKQQRTSVRQSENNRSGPPLPLKELELSENARTVLAKRYLRRGPDGKPAETIHEMFWRVASHVAQAEAEMNGDPDHWARVYYDLLSDLRFFPNSPTFTGAGTPLGQLAACFTAAMRVTTAEGTKRIADLLPGDLVLTHQGRYRPVIDVFRRPYKGKLLRIKMKLIGTPLEVTPEHPILTPQGWVKAGSLKVGSRVAIGVLREQRSLAAFDLGTVTYPAELELQETAEAVRVRRPSSYQNSGRQASWVKRFIDVTPDLGRLCGYYVSEGTIGPDECYVRFTFSGDEIEYHDDVARLLQVIFGINAPIRRSNYGNWVQIDAYNRPLASWFREHFGTHSHGKRLPVWLQSAEPEIQEAFLIGVLRGDGLFFEREYDFPSGRGPQMYRAFRLVLSNPDLIHQIWQMCLRLGYDAAIRSVDTTYVTPNARDAASVRLPPLRSRDLIRKTFGRESPGPEKRGEHRIMTREGDQAYVPISSIEIEDFEGVVYNCEVEEDHSYVTEGVVVHNCFVLAIDDDMGRTESGIFQTLRDAALIQQTGGGNGFSFSRLRPKGALVKSSMGKATGPVGFLRVYDQAFGEVAQGGSRRGANMSVLRVDHPDIREFITCKTNESQITNFNISVGITDDFMRRVEADETIDLVNPADGVVWETVRAREIFDLIARQAHHNGEPGVLFLDAANRTNPVPHLYELEATNPCVAGSTRIATHLGLLTIQELADRGLPLFVVTDGRAPFAGTGKPSRKALGIALRPATPAWRTRENVPVTCLTTEQGYSVTATPDHAFLTPTGYVKLHDLKPGDKLLLQSSEGAWSQNYELPNVEAMYELIETMAVSGDRASGATKQRRDFWEQYANIPSHWSHDLGLVMGWLVGDGWLTKGGNGSLGIVFESDDELALVHEPMREWFGSGHVHNRSSVKQLTYARLPYEFFRSLGVKAVRAHEKCVPDSIWGAPREAVVGFLQGLFSADGTVYISEAKQDCTVRLASSSQTLLKDVQVLLGNFGIVSRVCQRREAHRKLMPDGKGGQKLYDCHAQYELIIGGANRDRFADLIGFADPRKQQRLVEFIGHKKRQTNREMYEDIILSIEDAGVADVYDLTEPYTHSFVANAIVIHNCGEQWLGPFENCCLGSVNLARLVTDDDRVDWDGLRRAVEEATRFLDDVVTANAYVPAVPQLKEAAHRVRRIGLGIMGLADMMYRLGVRYGSEEGQEFAGQIMEFVRYHTMRTSIELAKERGPFPAIKGSIYDPADLKWRPPQPLTPYKRDWGRPALDWGEIVEGIRQHGIRNGAQNTVAPTGTIATVAGCEGYGCEPVFALAYVRHVNDNGKDLELQYTSPLFERALRRAGLDEATIERVVKQVNETGTCQGIAELPAWIRHTFVVSSDVTVEEHVRMQAALQAFVDNSISKTVNMPETATVEDVKQAYKLAWELGCKGITVYVTGSREKVVLETKATQEAKSADGSAAGPSAPKPADLSAAPLFDEAKKPRPRVLAGKTYRVNTPLGATYVTINENGKGEGQPFEVFLTASKAGSDTAAVSEALGRLISYILRLVSPISPRQRLKEIVRQLAGIGGGRATGFGPARVRSLPDGVAQMLQLYLEETEPPEADRPAEAGPTVVQAPLPLPTQSQAERRIGDLCPECGQAAVVNEEGCRKCYSCGYSEC